MKEKKAGIPILFNKKSDCCGCEACEAACNISAIKMCYDKEGFAYPVINKKKCIRCYCCIKVCPIK